MFQLVFFCQDLLLFPVDFIFQGSLVIQFIFGALNLRVKPENTAIQPLIKLLANEQRTLIITANFNGNYFAWLYFLVSGLSNF